MNRFTHSTARRLSVGTAAALALVGLCAQGTAAAADRTPAAAASPSPLAASTAGAGRLDPHVIDLLRAKGYVDVMVMVDQLAAITDTTEAGAAGSAARAHALKAHFADQKAAIGARSGADMRVIEDYEYLPVELVRVWSEAAVQDLVNDPQVSHIGATRSVETTAMDSESPAMIRQPLAAASGYTGNGTFTAVLDTGVDYRQADFGYCAAPGNTCRVVTAFDVAAEDGQLDNDGHGTNVAGIVAGIAPATKLIVLDVFSYNAATNDQRANDPDIAKAINMLISWKQQGYNITSVNLSLGGGSYDATTCPADTIGLGTARANGILPVVAAGNNTSTAGVAWPACVPAALSVGAVYDANIGGAAWGRGTVESPMCTDLTTAADKVTCFSQSGPTLKMLAPGAMIDAAGITEGGTSQAAPHVAAAAAILASAKPSAGPAGWEAALTRFGPTLVDRDGRTRTRLDVVSALNGLLGAADVTAPTVSTPIQSVTPNTTLTSTATVTVSWSATDPSGIAAFDLYSSTNGGAWIRETLATATSMSKTFLLTPGTQYQFTVAAKDGAGNWSNWINGPAFRAVNYTERSTAISYSSGWTRAAWSAANGGYVQLSGTTGASATFTFTGRGVAWVASLGSNRGVAKIYIDGILVASRDLYSATAYGARVVHSQAWSTSGTHTIKVVVAGTAGRPTIDVDSFVMLG